MSSTRCTCLRSGLTLLVQDPECPAPLHVYDLLEELGESEDSL